MKQATKNKIKRVLHKIRIYTIKSITMAAFIIFLVSVCCLDSETYIPTIIMIISFSWLVIFMWANNMFYEN